MRPSLGDQREGLFTYNVIYSFAPRGLRPSQGPNQLIEGNDGFLYGTDFYPRPGRMLFTDLFASDDVDPDLLVFVRKLQSFEHRLLDEQARGKIVFAADSRAYGFLFFDWTPALLKRMEKDPTWPPWIPVK